MGEYMLNRIEKEGDLYSSEPCQTSRTPLIGGEPLFEGWQESLKEFDQDIQEHLYQAYGSLCVDVANLATKRELKKLKKNAGSTVFHGPTVTGKK